MAAFSTGCQLVAAAISAISSAAAAGRLADLNRKTGEDAQLALHVGKVALGMGCGWNAAVRMDLLEKASDASRAAEESHDAAKRAFDLAWEETPPLEEPSGFGIRTRCVTRIGPAADRYHAAAKVAVDKAAAHAAIVADASGMKRSRDLLARSIENLGKAQAAGIDSMCGDAYRLLFSSTTPTTEEVEEAPEEVPPAMVLEGPALPAGDFPTLRAGLSGPDDWDLAYKLPPADRYIEEGSYRNPRDNPIFGRWVWVPPGKTQPVPMRCPTFVPIPGGFVPKEWSRVVEEIRAECEEAGVGEAGLEIAIANARQWVPAGPFNEIRGEMIRLGMIQEDD